jgi:hypothetical protein
MRFGSLLALAACIGMLAACTKKKANSPAPPAPTPAGEPPPDGGAAEAGEGQTTEPPAGETPVDPTLVRFSGRLLPPPASTATGTGTQTATDTASDASAESFELECVTLESSPSRCRVELAPPDYEFTLECGDWAHQPFACALRDASGLVLAPIVLGDAHTLLVGHGTVAMEIELLPARRLAVAALDEDASTALGAKSLEELAATAVPDLTGSWELRRTWCGRKEPCEEPPGDDPEASAKTPREPDLTAYLRHDVEAGWLELWRSEADYTACHDDAGKPALRVFPPGDGAAVSLADKLADVDQYLAALATPFGEALAARLDAVASARAVAAGFPEASYPNEYRTHFVNGKLGALSALIETARHYAADFYVVFDAEGRPTAKPFCEVERGFYDAGAELPVHLEALCGDGAGTTDEQHVAQLKSAQAALAKSCVPWVGVLEDWTGYDGSASFRVAMRTYCASIDGLCLDAAGAYKGELPWRAAVLQQRPSHAGRFAFSAYAAGSWSLIGKDETTSCARARLAGFAGQLSAAGTLDAIQLEAVSESCAVAQPRAPRARPIGGSATPPDPDDFGGSDFGEPGPLSEWFSVLGIWTRVDD